MRARMQLTVTGAVLSALVALPGFAQMGMNDLGGAAQKAAGGAPGAAVPADAGAPAAAPAGVADRL